MKQPNQNKIQHLAAFEAAQIAEACEGKDPIDSKLAKLCQKDRVRAMGDCSETMGACAIEGCPFQNDKFSGPSGFCLKREVGVAID